MKTGAPTKRSPEREKAILAALQVGNTRRASVRAAEISEDTFARWMAADADFRGAVQKAEADAELRFLGQVAKAAAGRSWQAAAWWLERRQYADYARRERMDVTMDVRKVAERLAADLDGVSADELVATAERISKGLGP